MDELIEKYFEGDNKITDGSIHHYNITGQVVGEFRDSLKKLIKDLQTTLRS